jgi:hypothetical protein
MRARRLIEFVYVVLVPVAILSMMPNTANAWEDYHLDLINSDISAGYPAPLPAGYSFAGPTAGPIYPSCFYTVPILAVYQCPAVITDQPGSRVVYLPSNLTPGLLGGQPYLYHQ